VGTPKDFGAFSADKTLGGITAASGECLSGGSSETRNFRQCSPMCDVELKVVLICMGTARSICCGDHANIAYISVGTHFCTYSYVEWDFFCSFK
jgi:hypothetical protein